jgi:hypothetical protein
MGISSHTLRRRIGDDGDLNQQRFRIRKSVVVDDTLARHRLRKHLNPTQAIVL